MVLKFQFNRFFIFLASATMLFILIAMPVHISNGIKKGLFLCGNIIIPTLFPFSVFSLLMYNSGALKILPGKKTFYNKVFGVNKNTFMVFIMSCIGGYPIGAKLLDEAVKKRKISRNNAQLMLCCCINAGPAFVITAVGELILNSKQIGYMLFFSHIIASLIIFLFLHRRFTPEENIEKPNREESLPEVFVDSVYSSTKAIITICSYVLLFSGITEMVTNSKFNNIAKQFLIGILEVTNAVSIIDNIYIISAVIGFSGLSIIFQIKSISKDFLPKLSTILSSRIIHSVLSVLILRFFFAVFPITLPTISNNTDLSFSFNSSTMLLSFIMMFMAFMLILSVKVKRYCGKLKNDIF